MRRNLLSAILPILATLGLALASPLAAQQTGVLVGVVVDDQGQPIPAAHVQLEGTSLGTVTNDDGRFILRDVPRGTYSVVVERLGFAAGHEENVRIRADATTTVEIELRTTALSIEGIVVTGVVDPISGKKLPFTVGRVTDEQMPVPSISTPVAALQGRVAGVHAVSGSGQPGTGVSVQLRTPTSIQRSSAPLYVVDGVILAGSTVDIESLDVESIEVVKGAAAASLYGSRAAGGVIQIRTKRGRGAPMNETRIVARTEMGRGQLANKVPLAQHHFWEVDQDGNFVLSDDPTGTLSDRQRRVQQDVPFMDQAYGVEVFDQLDQFFNAGDFRTSSATMSQNLESTNWMASFANRREQGIILTNDGLTQNSFRLNLDHRLRDDFTLGFSGYHMRNHRDDLSGSPFWDLLLLPPDVNLLAKDSVTGGLINQPDPTLPMENPIWRQTSRDNHRQRMRTLANVNARFQPLSGLTFRTDFSYDRLDRQYFVHVPKGTPRLNASDDDPGLNGNMSMSERRTDQVNASASATYLINFGNLTTRTTVRGLIERESFSRMDASGGNFLFNDVPRIGATENISANSSQREVKANGYFLNTGLDYGGKYIADLLIRRDGSSLFGPEARWNTYYRAAVSYLMAEEPWWPVPALTDFKINYSIGTAGGRPNFGDRFETVGVSSSGAINRSNLGNRFLKPEHTTEQEVGLLAVLNNRYSLQLTRAHAVTTDQLVQMPQPAASGFFAQWQNSGTIEGTTYEATLEAQILSTPDLSWSANLIADRSRHEITEWNRPCFQSGVTYRCGGETLGIYYGQNFARSMDELPARFQDAADQFDINDEGYVVWVGEGGSWQDVNWGESATVGERGLDWGLPIRTENEEGQIENVRIGDRNPHFKMGLGNNVRWKGLSFYGLVDATIGGEIYNHTKQRLYQHERHADLDQAGKPLEEKKPVQYYAALYNANQVNSHFVEDGTFLKVRELSLRYAFGSDMLQRVWLDRIGTNRVSLGLIGRNLLTFTSYTGFDPEVGSTTLQTDSFGYPNFRTVTGFVEVQF